MQTISNIKPKHEQREAAYRHADSAARDGVDCQEDTAEKKGWTEILLKKKEQERQADASQNRQDVLAARQIDPLRQPDVPDHLAAKISEQFPPASEITGQKKSEQQADGFDRLDRTQIDFCGAAPRSGAEKYQQRRQGQRAGERQVAELDESSLAEIEKRKACHQDEAQYGSFGEPYKQEAVAQWIGPAQEDGKTNGSQQVCDRYQERVTPDSAQPPYQCHEMESQNVEAAEQEYLIPEVLARSYAQKRLQRREICRGEKRYDFRRRAAGIRGFLADQLQPLREVVQLPGAVYGSRIDSHTRDGTDIRQRASLAALVDKKPKQLLRSKPPVVHVSKNCSDRRFKLLCIDDRIQIHGLNARACVRRLFKDAEAADIGERDSQYRDARSDGQRSDPRDQIRRHAAADVEHASPQPLYRSRPWRDFTRIGRLKE